MGGGRGRLRGSFFRLQSPKEIGPRFQNSFEESKWVCERYKPAAERHQTARLTSGWTPTYFAVVSSALESYWRDRFGFLGTKAAERR